MNDSIVRPKHNKTPKSDGGLNTLGDEIFSKPWEKNPTTLLSKEKSVQELTNRFHHRD